MGADVVILLDDFAGMGWKSFFRVTWAGSFCSWLGGIRVVIVGWNASVGSLYPIRTVAVLRGVRRLKWDASWNVNWFGSGCGLRSSGAEAQFYFLILHAALRRRSSTLFMVAMTGLRSVDSRGRLSPHSMRRFAAGRARAPVPTCAPALHVSLGEFEGLG